MILSDDNLAASLLSRPGEAIYNDMSGLVEGKQSVPGGVLSAGHAGPIPARTAKEDGGPEHDAGRIDGRLRGNEFSELRNNSPFMAQVARKVEPTDVADRIWLGRTQRHQRPTDVRFLRQSGANLLVVGERGDAQLAMCSTSILCLAAGSAPKNISIRVLDGTLQDSGGREHLNALAQALPTTSRSSTSATCRSSLKNSAAS